MGKLIKTGLFMLWLWPFIAVNAQQLNDNPSRIEVKGNQIAAKVGTHEIKMLELIQAYNNLSPQQQQAGFPALYQNLLERIISFYLILEEGKKAGMGEDEQVKAQMKRAQDAVIHQAYIRRLINESISDEAVENAYQQWLKDNPAEEERQASHILLKTKEEAQAAFDRHQAGEDFAQLATALSQGPSARQGGDLGWFGRGKMVPEFENRVFNMNVDAVSPPFQTQFGWHIVQLTGIRKLDRPSLQNYRNFYVNQQADAILSEKIKQLSQNQTIERFDLTGKPIE